MGLVNVEETEVTLPLYLSPRITADQVKEIFSQKYSGEKARGRWLSLFIAGRPKKLLKIEMVWLLYYLIPFEVRRGQSKGVIKTLIESYSATFLIIDALEKPTEQTFSKENTLPPGCNPDKAVELARQLFATAALRTKNLRQVVVDGCLTPREIYYPYWVCYFCVKNSLDFIALDGITGEKVPTKLKSALVQAFLKTSQMLRKEVTVD